MIELYPFQHKAHTLMDQADGRCLISMDMGLGKTLTSLKYAQQNKQLPTLVICPASVKYNWEHEASRLNLRCDMCEGRKAPQPSRNGFHTVAPVTIINYDIAPYWVDYLKSIKFRTLILDECQNLTNMKTKRTKACRTIAKEIRSILALSGTPLLNRPAELFPILNILWPKSYNSFFSFAQAYCAPRLTPWGWQYSGATNLDQLHKELLNHGMVRMNKKDVMQDLPDVVRQVCPLQIRKPEEYVKADKDFINWLKQEKGFSAAKRASRSEKMMKMGYQIRLAAKLKLKAVVDWANDFLENTDEKLILFAVHRKAIEVLQDRINYPSVKIDGSVSSKMRKVVVDQFRNQSKTRVCIANMLAGGVGTDGLQIASNVGIVEFPWRPGDLAQAESRADRIGQKNTVFVHYFVAKGTIEEDLCKVLQRKKQVITSVLDGGADLDDFNLYDEVLKELENRLF